MSERLMWNVLNSFPSWEATSTALQAGDDSLTWRIEVHDDGWFYAPKLATVHYNANQFVKAQLGNL